MYRASNNMREEGGLDYFCLRIRNNPLAMIMIEGREKRIIIAVIFT
jgi:hypothetical protein